ncbi:hypothetical protein [Chroococcidiopsis sp. SAG 2025]|uniref:hypothetical protein n=1 Tax=Chroococcidiopsis sp. SAG 2025 TaxID=171389 RepID=UPI002936F410|nr:hypothetical protein [Chroococcidiopsis sp. SAG 2025]
MLFSITAPAQTDINVNNKNIIRVGGDVIVLPNQVVENAIAIGGDTTIGEGARVTQTAIAIGGDAILEKGVRVDGDVYAVGGEIIAQPGATIGGTSGTVLEDGRWGMYGSRRRGADGFFFVRYLFGSAFHLLNVAIGAIIGVLILLWRPNFLLTLAAIISQYPLASGLWGLGGMFAVILLVIVLAVSLIGIPLLPLVGLAVAITALVGTLGVALWLGQRSLKAPGRSPVQQFLLGMLILALIGLIPVLGGLVLSVANIFGFGAILAWLLGRVRPQVVA